MKSRQVLEDLLECGTRGLERSFIEPTSIKNGKTRLKLNSKKKFPRNWKVGHAMKF